MPQIETSLVNQSTFDWSLRPLSTHLKYIAIRETGHLIDLYEKMINEKNYCVVNSGPVRKPENTCMVNLGPIRKPENEERFKAMHDKVSVLLVKLKKNDIHHLLIFYYR